MKQHLLIGGALALAFTAAAPAAAQPDHAGHGKHGAKHQQAHGYNQPGCPPGLAKKNNGCLPPGQAKKLGVGQRYADSYGYRRYRYDALPYEVRNRYFGDRPDYYDNYNYYYDQGSLYRVDPRTLVVEQIINAILR
ncbi:hypothetical protein [Sphingomonas sp. LHG3406-1]|uniref:hypothetical protein n=1 Tax=Sphingomonas sp. LHG3406-1 TaxID=2804617 RepID=UPI00261744CF|nr:hypothetical protein [Sphingomonas sp. LHG3406-1]